MEDKRTSCEITGTWTKGCKCVREHEIFYNSVLLKYMKICLLLCYLVTFFETQMTGEYKLINFKKWFLTFLSAFAKFRKSSSCLSVCLHVTTRLSPERPFFRKSAYQIQVSLQLSRITETWHGNLCIFMKNISLKSSQNEKYFRQSYRKNQDTCFTFDNFFPLHKSCRLWVNVGKYSKTRQTTDDNMILLIN
jgi:hypothetical protein